MEVLIELEEGIVTNITYWANNDPDPVIRAKANSSPKFFTFDHTSAEMDFQEEVERALIPEDSTDLIMHGSTKPASCAERIQELENEYREKENG